jgi:tetratricopeptide (TPR) repeat protein
VLDEGVNHIGAWRLPLDPRWYVIITACVGFTADVRAQDSTRSEPATSAVPPEHGLAPATPVAGEDSHYRQLIAQAVEEFHASHFVEARALFERAHAISPNARTFRGLGITAFELRRYTLAVRELNAALEDLRNPLPPALREEVSTALARASGSSSFASRRAAPKS